VSLCIAERIADLRSEKRKTQRMRRSVRGERSKIMKSSEDIAGQYNQFVMPTYAPALSLVRGSGTRVWDADGKVYLDFLAGISVLNVGHCHPKVVEAIRQQAGELMHVSNLYYTEKSGQLARRLSTIGLGGKCFFANSGAEANEGMIKLARMWGNANGRYEIICMENSFHGRTLATAAATGQEKVRKGFEPLPEGFVHAAYNDLESVSSKVSDKTVAVLVEAIQGEGGVVPAEPEFLEGIRSLCDENSMLMLCDEVQCGMGRSGEWFAYSTYGVTPDACSLAKALGGGFPIGAVLASPALSDVFHPGNHASTFGGTPLACAAALATLDVIDEEDLLARAAEKGTMFQKQLAGLVETFEHVVDVRGRGLMLGIVLDQPAQPLVDLLTDMGLLTAATAQNVVRLLPPLNATDDEFEEALDMIRDCLEEWHGTASPEDDDSEIADVSESKDSPSSVAAATETEGGNTS